MSRTRSKPKEAVTNANQTAPVDVALDVARQAADSPIVRREIRRVQQLRVVDRALEEPLEELVDQEGSDA